MNFEYAFLTLASSNIEIEDIGNCCLQSFDALKQEYYLVIKTSLGETQVITYGPIYSDLSTPPATVSYFYQKFQYSQKKICKIIEQFLSGKNGKVTEVKQISEEEAFLHMRDLKSFLQEGV